MHFFPKHLVHVGNVDAFVGEFRGECRELVSEDGDLSLEVVPFLLELGEALPDLGQLSLLAGDVRLELLVVLLFTVELLLVVLQVRPLLVEEVFRAAILLTRLVDQLVSLATVLDRVLPLQVQLMPLSVQSLELLRCLVELDLCRLRLSHFLLELL